MLYNSTKFYQSISKSFSVTDLNIRANAGVVANVDDGQTDRKPDPYIAPCLRQARQKCTLTILSF